MVSRGMSAEAVRLDVDLLIMTSGEDPDLERRALESLISRRVDGIATRRGRRLRGHPPP